MIAKSKKKRDWRRRPPAPPKHQFLVRFSLEQFELIEEAVDRRRANNPDPNSLPTITGFIIGAAIDRARAEAAESH